MKKLYSLFKPICITLCCCLYSTSYAALNGAYTISPSLAASATNYKSFQSAISDMLSGTRADGGISNGTGVSGPVIFNVAAGTYTGQIDILDTIPGSSSINNITFEGTDALTRIIEYNSTNTNSRHTVKLSGTRYITLRNLTIRTLGTYGWAIHMNAHNTNRITIKKCVIEMLGPGIGASSQTHVGILFNASNSNLGGTGFYADSIIIDSNTIYEGYQSIVLMGDLGSEQLDNRITNNKIYNSTGTTITCRFQNGIHIINNYIKPTSYLSMGSPGISIDNIITTAPSSTIVSYNTIERFTDFGLNFVAVTNPSNQKAQIFNNLIGSGYGTGIRIEFCEEMNLSNNTVNLKNGNEGVDAALYCDDLSLGITVYNNILSVSEVSPILPVFALASAAFDAMDYNVFYRADVSNKKLLFLAKDLDPTSFVGYSGFNTHSLFKKPAFLNDSNLRVSNSCDKGLTNPFITNDIDGIIRNSPPTIGAHEGSPLRHNLMVQSIVSPSFPVDTGLKDLVVRVQNIGDSAIASFNLTYVHNGSSTVTQAWTGSLNPCDTVSVVFSGANRVHVALANDFVIYSSLPNGVTDPQTNNDTLRKEMFAALSGHYIIGSSINADFTTFGEAVDALKTAGIAAAVVFEVEPGTYNEQVSIDDNILGVSATKTITFDGIDASTRIIDNDVTDFGIYHTFQIGSSYVRLLNLTIRASNIDFAWGVYINKRNSHDIHVKNCVVDIVNTQPNERFAGIAIIGGTGLNYEDIFRVDNIEIDSNIINNGYVGIYHKNFMFNPAEPASTKLYFRNNTLNNQISQGIYIEKAYGIIVDKNTIVMNKDDGQNGINITYAFAPDSSYKLNITNNSIRNANTTGIAIYTATNNPLQNGLIANNSVICSGYDGIILSDATYIDVVHNTVKMVEFSTFPGTAALALDNCSDINVLNNHLVVSEAISSVVPLYVHETGAMANCNYNNFYKKDTANLIYIDGWFAQSNFRGGSGFNTNSIYVNPQFKNDSTLIPVNGCMNAPLFPRTLTDINDSLRSSLTDIGAYQIIKKSIDLAVVKLVAPIYPIDSGNQDLQVQIANRGSSPITSANISYVLNSGSVITQQLPLTLNSCDTTTIVFSGLNQLYIANGTQNILKVYTHLPNSSQDEYNANDTLTTILSTPMKGIYTIGATGADYTSINEVKNALEIRGIAGAVIFRIKKGTYHEQVLFSGVSGTSETNTITFTSEASHADSVTIEYNPSASPDNYVIRLSAASFFNFKYLTVKSTYGKVFEIMSRSLFDTIDHCKIQTVTGVNTNLVEYSAIYAGTSFTGNKLTITHNTITGGSAGALINGLSQSELTDKNTISGNTISGTFFAAIHMVNTCNSKINNNTISGNSANAAPNGIYCFYGDSALEIKNNKITMTTGGYGLNVQNCDATIIQPAIIANNAISVSGTKASYGIRNQASSWMKIYHNSILVNSTVSSFAGYFHYNGMAFRFNEIKNNALANTGTGVAMYFYNPTYFTPNAESDYNNLYAAGSNLIQRGTPSSNYSLVAWKAIANNNKLEAHSLSYRPGFTSNSNLFPNVADSASWSLNGRGMHLDSTITGTDLNGIERPKARAAGAPDIGAYEFMPTAIPPVAVAVPATPIAGTSQAFLFGTDTVAKISWDALSAVPPSVAIRYYSGEATPHIHSSDYHTKAYWSVLANAGTYNYTLDLYYNNPVTGNLPNEAEMKTAKHTNTGGWVFYQTSLSTADTTRNILSTPYLTDFSMFLAGTDNTQPLPVSLRSFAAATKGNHVITSWTTASEKNNRGFEIERSGSSKDWKKVGFMEGKGNSNVNNRYQFTDENAFINEQTSILYYRLKQIDLNGRFEYTPIVAVSNKEKSSPQITVSPNPFQTGFAVNIKIEKEAEALLEIYDLNGKKVMSERQNIQAGNNLLNIEKTNDWNAGIYFVIIDVDNERKTIRVVKY
jgi:parallel beta-helix repeat protein